MLCVQSVLCIHFKMYVKESVILSENYIILKVLTSYVSTRARKLAGNAKAYEVNAANSLKFVSPNPPDKTFVLWKSIHRNNKNENYVSDITCWQYKKQVVIRDGAGEEYI